MNEPEVRLALTEHISEMLLQMTDPDIVSTAQQIDEARENFREIAFHLFESLNFSLLEASEGTYKVSLTPIDPETYVDKVLAEEENAR
jgi:hypothetical protein